MSLRSRPWRAAPLFDQNIGRPFVPTTRSPADRRHEGQGRGRPTPPRRGLALTLAAPAARLAALGTIFLAWLASAPATAQPLESNPCARLSDAALAPLIDQAAGRAGLPASWIAAVVRRESGGEPCAVSTKGAMGLMQLMPATWSTLAARLSLGSSPFAAADNLLAGAVYLRELYDRFGASGMLAAYNAGPGRYLEARSGGRALPAETQAYVAALAPRLQADGAAATPPVRGEGVLNTPVDALFAHLAPLTSASSDGAGGAASDLFVIVGAAEPAP